MLPAFSYALVIAKSGSVFYVHVARSVWYLILLNHGEGVEVL